MILMQKCRMAACFININGGITFYLSDNTNREDVSEVKSKEYRSKAVIIQSKHYITRIVIS